VLVTEQTKRPLSADLNEKLIFSIGPDMGLYKYGGKLNKTFTKITFQEVIIILHVGGKKNMFCMYIVINLCGYLVFSKTEVCYLLVFLSGCTIGGSSRRAQLRK
jgi:hypothetical protein